MLEEREIGARIKALRNKRGLVLEELAARTGFTKGYLSKVENSKKAPPVSTLIEIAKALGVRLSEIFGEDGSLTSRCCLTPRNKRVIIARDGTVYGYSYESLAHGYPSRHMDPYLITLPPEGRQPLFKHKGEEMVFVLEGKMIFYHSGQKFILEEGDCVYFDASAPHNGYPLEGKPVKSLMIIYTPEPGSEYRR